MTTRPISPAGRARKLLRERTEFIRAVNDLEQTAHRLGLHVAAHTLNEAKNAAGWVMAGNDEAAALAARGERPR